MSSWDPLFIYASIILMGYAYWWFSFLWPYHRWKSLPPQPITTLPTQGVSILIPFRNEAHRIEPLLKSLRNVHFPESVEILFCDDHSSDSSVSIIESYRSKLSIESNILTLPTNQNGKKSALQMGIDRAKHPVIFTTDADCTLHPNCLMTLLSKMESEKADLILGIVEYLWSDSTPQKNSRKNPLQVYQCVENEVLSAIGWVESQKNNAAVANGANMMFSKVAFNELGGYQGHEHIGSGDDVLTLEKFLLSPKHKVVHAAHRNAVVYTNYETEFRSFFNQRMRWMKKTFLQKTQKTALKQTLVGLFMISLWVITGISVYRGTYETLALVWLGKLLVDSAGVRILCKKELPNPFIVVLVSALQVLWLPLLAMAASIIPYRWKSRPYRA